MKQIEEERKFLIKPIKSWIDLSKLLDGLVVIKKITQYYLKPEDNEPAARVRKTIENDEIIYHYNQKKPTKQIGALEETEYEISEKEYNKFLKNKDPKRYQVDKIRFVFDYKNQIFELDIFKNQLEGLAILEIELQGKKDKSVKLPPFLKVIKEVSKDPRYNNFNLSVIKK